MKWNLALAVLGASFVLPSVTLAQSFDLAKAVVAGSLCPVGTGKITADEKKLLVVFSSSDLVLLAGEPALTGLAACKVVLPLSVPRGKFISRVTHRVLADVEQSAGVESKIIVATAYNTLAPVQSEGTFPVGTARSGPYLLYKSTDTAALPTWVADMCSASRVADGILSTTLAASAVRTGSGESVNFNLNGAQHGLEIWVELASCP